MRKEPETSEVRNIHWKVGAVKNIENRKRSENGGGLLKTRIKILQEEWKKRTSKLLLALLKKSGKRLRVKSSNEWE